MEQTLVYDGTRAGFFTAIFEIYERKVAEATILKAANYSKGLFDEPRFVITDELKAKRVMEGFKRKSPKGILSMLIKVLHSELDDAEKVVIEVIRKAFKEPRGLRMDYRNDAILRMKQINKMMGREIHRMHAFVRFQKTIDDIYAATISPDFDVIPFIGDHFEKRYADQQWLIYDTKRDYGLFYDGESMQTVTLNNANWVSSHQISDSILAEDEQMFQKAWTGYFHATCIQERKNMRLHLQHVPHRYWKYLPEKTKIN
ncbi:TIGR03915 family putative DNA repair protein [Ekhidna sp.]|uniref:TIGR03915 family putative DNA repair protein n=1 Tax=Ekhidna sp. TaxID=2608089 RepID=UPI003BABFE3F